VYIKQASEAVLDGKMHLRRPDHSLQTCRSYTGASDAVIRLLGGTLRGW
jgi:hypothetical protein